MKFHFKDDPKKALFIQSDKSLEFIAPTVCFSEKILIESCTVTGFDVFGMYCYKGMSIKDSTFHCRAEWMSGGHNFEPVLFENCIFNEFVDFGDCSFEKEIIFRNVNFKKGTNLLGNKETPIEVDFEIYPVLENVQGDLEVNTYEVKK